MKVFLDENTPTSVTHGLRAVFIKHEFVSAYEQSELLGLDDVALFASLGTAGFDAIVTKDMKQLKVSAERNALHENGLSWIGFQMNSHGGMLGIGLAVATLTSAFPHVLDAWNPEQPTAFRLKGIGAQPGQRMTVSPIMAS